MEAASLIKLPILAEVFARVEAGSLTWKSSYPVIQSHIVGGSGKLKLVKPGTKVSLKTLTELMIAESDNTATEMLTNLIGISSVNRRAKSLGMTQTIMGRHIWDFEAINIGKDNYTTANDLLSFFENIYKCALNNYPLPGISKSSCQIMLDILKKQKNKGMIPKYLPVTLPVAHKTGELTGVTGDAGIIYLLNNPLIMCILINETNNDAAREDIARFAKKTIDLVQKGAKK